MLTAAAFLFNSQVDLGEVPTDLENEWEANDVVPDGPSDVNKISVPINLSALRRCYENNRTMAIYDIANRKHLVIDEEYIVPASLQNRLTNKTVYLVIEEPKIDQTTYVSRYVGLGAIIPTVERDESWVFQLSVRNQDVSFNAKHTNLGFDIDGNGIFVGRCQQQSVWIFMVPHDEIEQLDPVPPGTASGPAHMTKHRRRAFLLFLAKCFERLQLYDVYCKNPYADVSTDSEAVFQQETNIL